jgi:type II restriction/modification system DNA methylase subunit YeeA
MILNILKPRKALNKAFLKVKPNRSEIECFKINLIKLIDRINEAESEEFHKNIISDFLKDTYYKDNHFINTKGRNDLVIHNGKDAKSSVGIIIEAKKPANKSEMMRTDNINTKAFQELILYYLRERVVLKNLEIKYLIVTNIYEWFIFDAQLFERLFANNKQLIKKFTDFEEKRLSDIRTDFFYKEIAEPFINAIETEITFTHFDIRNFDKPLRNADKQDDNQLIALYKLLSPEHLLKLPFTNDSNSLDKSFYTELLHIIGLVETKEGGKKLIGRKKEGERNQGSFMESAIVQLESLDKISRLEKAHRFGATNNERLFNVALELSIIWINRILFLKLLEAQLINYNKGDKSFSFLNLERVRNFDDLNSLFFQVLARKPEERSEQIKKLFTKVPYLNSSLFEPTEIEHNGLFISQLKDTQLPILKSTVLKDKTGKKRTGQLATLEYLFEFLDAYDFAGEGAEEIQEDNKTLINASVLGLIFEKINGYKDGSFFTPGFITMYMCRETIRRAIVQKFNDAKKWNCQDINQLYDKIENKKEANSIINSLKICDPAVGSGHFLVSALNEIISIKNDLKILSDREGKRLKEYSVEVVSDELIVTDEDGKIFEYNPKNKESQRIQETLFHEKETLIENCLFGVDINSNSVKICRLRLWIELLKNAYYKAPAFTELETLPNIDINIKNGNSLISRYALDANVKEALRHSKWSIDSYRLAVMTYRNAENKNQKQAMEKLIDEIKSNFESEVVANDWHVVRLKNAKEDLKSHAQQTNIFELTITQKSVWEKKLKKITTDIKKFEAYLDEIKNNKIYENAFEWRFEFPEVLNDDGDFVGFDVVIGNPPYFALSKIKEQANYFEIAGYQTYSKGSDIYCLFYEKGIQIMKQRGLLTYISSNSWLRTQYGTLLRKYLVEKANPLLLLNIEDKQVFEEATVESNIITIEKAIWNKQLQAVSLKEGFGHESPLQEYFSAHSMIIAELPESGWTIGNAMEVILKAKIEKGSLLLEQYGNEIYRGFTTGFNDAFFISTEIKEKLIKEDPQCQDIIKPALRGKDISKYNYNWKDIWVILIKQGWTNENRHKEDAEKYFSRKYPSIYNFLKTTGETIKGKGKGLFERDDKGDYWWELRPCVYYEYFEKEKIVWGELSDQQKFAYDSAGLYANNTIFFITGKNLKYLLSVLNSAVAKWYFNEISTSSGMGTNRWLKYKIEQLPIKNITEKQQTPFIILVDKILATKKKDPNADTSALEKEIDCLVYQLYGLTEEEIKIVEQN